MYHVSVTFLFCDQLRLRPGIYVYQMSIAHIDLPSLRVSIKALQLPKAIPNKSTVSPSSESFDNAFSYNYDKRYDIMSRFFHPVPRDATKHLHSHDEHPSCHPSVK